MSVTGVDEIREADGDELGGIMGWLLYGDVTHDDVELFMAEEPAEWFPEGVDGGWEVEEVYVRKVPREYGWAYVYGGPGRGARKATKIERHYSWGQWCMNHIYEPASTGIPVEQVLDPIWPMVLAHITSPERRLPHRGKQDGDALVYLCRPCATKFRERQDAARREALANLRREEVPA
jgi:hypothetical protein